MIKPASYWALHKHADAYTIGRVGVALAGREAELDPPLSPTELALVAVVRQDSDWMDERVDDRRERDRKRKAAYRAAMSHGVPPCPTVSHGTSGTDECPTESAMSRGTDACPTPSIHPSVRPSVRPDSYESNNHSIPIAPSANGNGMDSVELTKDVNAFVAEVQNDPARGGNAFFDPRWDPVVIACAIAGDQKSVRRWRQAVNRLGEDAAREEMFKFYRELRAGESVENRGAALNARLAAAAKGGGS